MPTSLGYARHCDEVTEQTRLLLDAVRGADLGERVPTCPEWDLRELIAHMGQAHRYAGALVRARREEPVEQEAVPGFLGPEGGFAAAEPADLEAWLADGADELRETLRATTPDAPAESWFLERTAGFLARRMAHETVVHRADACRTTGFPYRLAPDLAADCIDEWLTIVTSTVAREYRAEIRALDEYAGSSLHLHATDAPDAPAVTDAPAATDFPDTTASEGMPGGPAEWLLEIHADGLEWRRAHAKATVALRGPLTDVLLAFLRRLPLDHGTLEVVGDKPLLETWLERVKF